jgi:hypothetical protein
MAGEAKDQEAAEALAPSGPKFPHPKILLMDLPDDVEQALSKAGYQVETGTFGAPIRVTRDPELVALPRGEAPANDTEQEIVIVDCAAPSPVNMPLAEADEGEVRLWQSAATGLINPRPLAMNALRLRALDRILAHRGVFIIFLDERLELEYVSGELQYRQLQNQERIRGSTWSFLSILDQIESKPDQGTEYSLTELGGMIPGLRAAMKGSSFKCTVGQGNLYERNWSPLATNKYGEAIAAVLSPDDEAGTVFLLPRIPDKARLVTHLISDFFPGFASQFYPHIKRSAWVKEPPYELPEVLALEQETAAVEVRAASEVKELETKVESKRAESSFIYELLTATDTELVTAVRQTLEMLGFKDVRDVDEEAENKTVRREDLQIWDRSPILLVEVKGITGLPKEEYALQVDKYVAPRIKEWKRFDVQGLTIINHQSEKLGLMREREHVFQEDVITHAEKREIGLLTTWELYRLARGYLRHNWEPEQVASLFYDPGVIEPIPSHYELVGRINRYFEKAGALTVDLEGSIQVGDTLAYELPIEFKEEKVTSLRLNDETVQQADTGVEIGISTNLSKEQARPGVRVYRVGTLAV